MRLGDRPELNVDAIPTGSLALDAALGIGGLPKGRIIEIYGPESSGKTTLALHVLAEAQKRGGEVAFVDAEHALDPDYAARIGVDIDSMLVSQPDTGEQALEITDALVRSGAVDVVVVDSVAALTPRAEIEGEMGDTFVGLQARLMSQALRKLAGTVSKTNCIVIFINQLRMKIGVMYGNPETTTGGNALKFYASVRIDIRRTEAIKSGTEIVGNRTRVKVIKNKCAPPFREAYFDIMYGEGISKWGELVDLAVQLELINKSGSWFSIGDERIGQGRDSAKQYLIDHPDVADRIEQEIRDNMWKLQGKNASRPRLLRPSPSASLRTILTTTDASARIRLAAVWACEARLRRRFLTVSRSRICVRFSACRGMELTDWEALSGAAGRCRGKASQRRGPCGSSTAAGVSEAGAAEAAGAEGRRFGRRGGGRRHG